MRDLPASAFRPLLRWTLAATKEQGSLVESLRNLAPMYRKRGAFQAEKLQLFLPTVLMLAIGGSATLFYALTLFVPLIQHAQGALVALNRLPAGVLPADRGLGSSRNLQASESRAMSDSQEQVDAKGTLTPEETGRLTDRIAGLARSGRPLGPGLGALGSELPHGRLRQSLFELSAGLEPGQAAGRGHGGTEGAHPASSPRPGAGRAALRPPGRHPGPLLRHTWASAPSSNGSSG